MEAIKTDIYQHIIQRKRAHWNVVWLQQIDADLFFEMHGTIKFSRNGVLLWELIPRHPYTDIFQVDDAPLEIMQALDWGFGGCSLVIAWDKSV